MCSSRKPIAPHLGAKFHHCRSQTRRAPAAFSFTRSPQNRLLTHTQPAQFSRSCHTGAQFYHRLPRRSCSLFLHSLASKPTADSHTASPIQPIAPHRRSVSPPSSRCTLASKAHWLLLSVSLPSLGHSPSERWAGTIVQREEGRSHKLSLNSDNTTTLHLGTHQVATHWLCTPVASWSYPGGKGGTWNHHVLALRDQ